MRTKRRQRKKFGDATEQHSLNEKNVLGGAQQSVGSTHHICCVRSKPGPPGIPDPEFQEIQCPGNSQEF